MLLVVKPTHAVAHHVVLTQPKEYRFFSGTLAQLGAHRCR
jgi:hypothetical protein